MKKNTLLTVLVLLAVSGLLLHYRIHNFMVADKLHPGGFVFDRTKFFATLFPCYRRHTGHRPFHVAEDRGIWLSP